MKKIVMLAIMVLSFVLLPVGCGKKETNSELAARIEKSSTDLVYSVETMDELELSDLDSKTTTQTNSAQSTGNGARTNSMLASAVQTENSRSIQGNQNLSNNTSVEPPVVDLMDRNLNTRMLGTNPKSGANSAAPVNQFTNQDFETRTGAIGNSITSNNFRWHQPQTGMPEKTATNRAQNISPVNTQTGVNSKQTTNNNRINSVSSTQNQKATYSLTSSDLGNSSDYSDNIIEKRSELLLLCSKLRHDDIKLSKESRATIKECLSLLKSTANYLDQTKGVISSGHQNAINAGSTEKTIAGLISLREKVVIRQAKLQTCMMAMDHIIEVLGGNTTARTAASKTQKVTTNQTQTQNAQGNQQVANTRQTNENGINTSNKTSGTQSRTNTSPQNNSQTFNQPNFNTGTTGNSTANQNGIRATRIEPFTPKATQPGERLSLINQNTNRTNFSTQKSPSTQTNAPQKRSQMITKITPNRSNNTTTNEPITYVVTPNGAKVDYIESNSTNLNSSATSATSTTTGSSQSSKSEETTNTITGSTANTSSTQRNFKSNAKTASSQTNNPINPISRTGRTQMVGTSPMMGAVSKFLSFAPKKVPNAKTMPLKDSGVNGDWYDIQYQA